MKFLLRHLSLSYFRRHTGKTLLTLLGVVIGVATFTAIRSARETLLDGLRSTVDRISGKAQLQIAADGGVPEELLEALWELDGLVAAGPIIQQIVIPEQAELGSVLVLGVDLLGDRELRDYEFEGEDQDLDDPLLFLAQPDSMALSRELAERAGIKKGDAFRFRTELGQRTVVVRGLLDAGDGFASAYGGNLAVVDVYAAQQMFGRGRRFDRIEARLADGISIDDGRARLLAAVGPGYPIETPARRSAQMENVVTNFAVGFTISSVFALAIGTFLIFNAFSVSVNRRRRDIGTLRALGATPRQVQVLFLAEAVFIGLIGGVLGTIVGGYLSEASLAAMSGTVATIYGLHDHSTASVSTTIAVQSLLLGVLASLAGAWEPARAAAAVRPTDALARGSFQFRVGPTSKLRLGGGVAAFALAITLAIVRPYQGEGLVILIATVAALGALLLTSPVARQLMNGLAVVLGRSRSTIGLLAVDSMRSNPRRTAGTILAMTFSLAFVVGMGGYIESTNATLARWMTGVLTSDLYVRASATLVRPDFRYPPELRDELLAIPGVRAVESFRGLRYAFRGDEILVMSLQIDGLLDRADYDFKAGDEDTMRRGLVHARKCAVSENFARRFGFALGDVVELDTPTGVGRLPIAAIVSEYSSDKGAIYIDRATFLEMWQDDRVDTFDVSLVAGADPHQVRDAIRAQIGGRYPALISTQAEFRAEIGKAIDAFYVLMQVTLVMALGVAFLGIVSSLLISVAERTREIGILKALGAVGRQIRWSVVLEAQAVAFIGLVIAIPLGALQARFLETTVAEIFTGWRMPHHFATITFVQLLIGLPVTSAIAAWIPARSAAATPVTEAIEYE